MVDRMILVNAELAWEEGSYYRHHCRARKHTRNRLRDQSKLLEISKEFFCRHLVDDSHLTSGKNFLEAHMTRVILGVALARRVVPLELDPHLPSLHTTIV